MLETMNNEMDEELQDIQEAINQEADDTKSETTEADKEQESNVEESNEEPNTETEKTVDEKENTNNAAKSPKYKKGSRKNGVNSKVLEMELEKQKHAVEEYQDKYKRLLAEFENARAREAKEATRMYDVGAKTVLEKLLPVVDNFERALQAVSEEDKDRAFEQGVNKIYKQMMVTLEEIGVAPMNAKGTEFNPDYHNAVMHIEDEQLEENVVAEEMQKGYMYKESVLRHSMVTVAN